MLSITNLHSPKHPLLGYDLTHTLATKSPPCTNDLLNAIEEALNNPSEEEDEQKGEDPSLSQSWVHIDHSSLEDALHTIEPSATPFSVLSSLFAKAPFTHDLFQKSVAYVFPGEHSPYLECLDVFRTRWKERNSTYEDLEIAHRILTQPMIGAALDILQQVQSFDDQGSLQTLIENDREAIRSSNLLEGPLHRALHKAMAVLNYFDPHANGNIPFLIGRRLLNNHPIKMLRHPVPTVETGSVAISPEYEAFLSYCQQNGKSILYCCLLNPEARDEAPRIEALRNLEKSYPCTFYFVRFPLDGPLHKADRFSSLEDYKEAIRSSLLQSLSEESQDFIFSPPLKPHVSRCYEDLLDLAQMAIKNAFLTDADSLEAKRALMMLFSSLLKDVLLTKMQITYYNNTCKDAIDRGTAHAVSDLVLHCLLTNTFEENKQFLRCLTAWPAFMAKTQPILSSRVCWLKAMVAFAENALAMEGCLDQFKRSYQSTTKITPGVLSFAL